MTSKKASPMFMDVYNTTIYTYNVNKLTHYAY